MVLHYLPASQYVMLTAEFTWFHAVSRLYMVLHYLSTSHYFMLTAEFTWFYAAFWLYMMLHYLPASQYVIPHAEITWHCQLPTLAFCVSCLFYKVQFYLLSIHNLYWPFQGGSVLLFMFRVCHAFLSVHCSFVVIYWERAKLLALVYVISSCVFVSFLL